MRKFFRKIFRLVKILWQTLKRPSTHISLGVLTLAGFVAGVIFWGGFNTALEATNTEAFCTSCHVMRDNVYQELQGTIHWENRSGVRATCPDCHVPHKWTHKIARKMQASKEVWGAIFGTISTREKFLNKRLELAQHEWARFSANKSLECKNCHSYKSMDWDKMSDQARRFMIQAAEKDQSCLDCHKGIAHHLPENMSVADPALAKLENQAQGLKVHVGESYFTVKEIDLFADEKLQQRIGLLRAASPVQVLNAKGEGLQVEIPAWRKAKGFGRVLYDDFGMNIVNGVIEKDFISLPGLMVDGENKTDEMTGLEWKPVKVTAYIAKDKVVASIDDLWSYAQNTYRSSCSVCHAQPDEGHFDANTWPALFGGMVGFTNMNGETQEIVLKYLQKHSSDFVQNAH